MIQGFNAIPKAVLTQRAAAIEDDRELHSGYNETSIEDPVAGSALLHHILLEERAELLADLNLSEEDLYWNRYYWFLFLKRLHELTEHDGDECEPMAQQLFDGFDEPAGVNYDLFPKIEALARRNATTHFRAWTSRKKSKKPKKKPG